MVERWKSVDDVGFKGLGKDVHYYALIARKSKIRKLRDAGKLGGLKARRLGNWEVGVGWAYPVLTID